MIVLLLISSPVLAAAGHLRERLTPEVISAVYPGAERLGPEEGFPPAIPVYKGDKIVAYLFSTLDVIAAPGYSTTPFDVIAGVDLAGLITGAKVVFHAEPHILHDATRERELDTFLSRQAGRALRGGTDPLPPDFVADSTISARAMRTAVLATASLVLRARARQATAATPATDTGADAFTRTSIDELLAKGAVVKRRVTSGEVAAALANAGFANAKLDWPLGKDDDLYIEFMTALATPAAIGGNLIGVVALEEYKSKLPNGAEAIYVASSGSYNFFGPTFAKDERFDRLRVVQDGRTFRFSQADYSFVVPVQGQQLAGLLKIPANSGFDPKRSWRLELLVNGSGASPASVAFGLDYKLPDLQSGASNTQSIAAGAVPESTEGAAPAAAMEPEPELNLEFDVPVPVPAWIEALSEARTNVAILAVLLALLTVIFVFQARLARHRLLHRIVRTVFLLVVLVWLGWTAGAQLSTVHVINYASVAFSRLDIEFYLAEPLVVILAFYTAISLLLIGRGVFCGWLCPFGALQELLGQLSRALGVPQWNPPAAWERYLWAGKYIAAAAVLILALAQLDPSGTSLEIEPFKTAITAKFTRAWPYLFYAGILLAIGLFTERAYCRFLCPLGGILAALDRLHLLNLLKRRPECGSPCHLCERSCPVRAIQPTGKIVTAECFQCLDCQVEYYDETRCPPLVAAAKLRDGAKPITAKVKNA